MAIDIKPLEVADLTQAKVEGTGAFDVLMRAMVSHIALEFDKGRLRGADYANVYLNAMAPVLQNAVVFLLQKDEAANKAALVEAQIKLTEAQAALVQVEIEREGANKELIQAQIDRIRREIISADLADAHTAAQTANIEAQTLNVGKQGLILDNDLVVSAKQIERITAEITQMTTQNTLTAEQVKKVTADTAVATQQVLNLVEEAKATTAQAAVATQQKLNLVEDAKLTTARTAQVTAENLNIPKQGLLLDAQTGVQTQQKLNLIEEAKVSTAQAAKVTADTAVSTQQKLNLVQEVAQSTAQTALITKQTANLTNTDLLVQAQTAEQKAQTINTGQQLLNLKAQECVLKSQYDMNLSQNLQIVAQTSLVNQKVATEKAQTAAGGVEADSVIGKQKLLYTAQTDGFKRDAEQKAAKLLADTWNVRRTTDVATVADTTNGLSDANIGRAISKLLTGVGA